MGGAIEAQLLEFGVYPGNKNLYGVYFSNLPFFQPPIISLYLDLPRDISSEALSNWITLLSGF